MRRAASGPYVFSQPASSQAGNIQRYGVETVQGGNATVGNATENSVDEFVEAAGVRVGFALLDGETDGGVRGCIEKEQLSRAGEQDRPDPALRFGQRLLQMRTDNVRQFTVAAQNRCDEEARERTVPRLDICAFRLGEGLRERFLEERAALHDAPQGFRGGLTGFEAGRLLDRLADGFLRFGLERTTDFCGRRKTPYGQSCGQL